MTLRPIIRPIRVVATNAGAFRRPYIYTEKEVAHLLDTALRLPCRLSALRSLTVYTMVLLAYCAGLRIQEVTNLNLGDVDRRTGTIDVRNSKFFKSRRLPLAPGVIKALRTTWRSVSKAGAPVNPEEGLFWHTIGTNDTRRKRREDSSLGVASLGNQVRAGKNGPRIHDLRHAMVSNRMLAWYDKGSILNHSWRISRPSWDIRISNHTHLSDRDTRVTTIASERFRQRAVHVLRNTEVPS